MHRRTLLAGLGTVSTAALAGCVGFADVGVTGVTDRARDTPAFDVRTDGSGGFILLRSQPQTPTGLVVGDEFDIGVTLGNTATGPVHGGPTVWLVSDTEGVEPQTLRIEVPPEDPLPSGSARLYRIGPFRASAAGALTLAAGNDFTAVHPDYDGIITVEPRAAR